MENELVYYRYYDTLVTRVESKERRYLFVEPLSVRKGLAYTNMHCSGKFPGRFDIDLVEIRCDNVDFEQRHYLEIDIRDKIRFRVPLLSGSYKIPVPIVYEKDDGFGCGIALDHTLTEKKYAKSVRVCVILGGKELLPWHYRRLRNGRRTD